MTVTLSLSPDGTYVVARVVGQLPLLQARQAIAETASMVKSLGATKLLVDIRKRKPRPAVEDFSLGEFVAADPTLRRLRTALLVRGPLDGPIFLETVARNRGVKVRSFDTDDAAVAWLHESPKMARDDQ
jgi:hypothetical protein